MGSRYSFSRHLRQRLLPSLGLLLPLAGAHAQQAPAWNAALTGSGAQTSGTSQTMATAVDASGNVFVTGTYSGRIVFGSTVLQSSGGTDLYVAKYVPATGTWAWAVSGGGTGGDQGRGIAVSGSSVYVTGTIRNTLADVSAVRFGGSGLTAGAVVQAGASTTISQDILLAKYTDTGATATVGWTQIGGGRLDDQGLGIAVNGSTVYLTGFIINTLADANVVRFGGSGLTPGTVAQAGASNGTNYDVFVAKYTDGGPAATLGWTQVGGGNNNDLGLAIAVNGSSVYVAGSLINNTADEFGVRFGGSGLTPGTLVGLGANPGSSQDALLVRYTDNGSTATAVWTQAGGGTFIDQAQGVAVSGPNVFVAGMVRPAATFGSFTLPTPAGVNVNFLASVADNSVLPVRKAQLAAGRLQLHPNPARGPVAVAGLPAGTPVALYDGTGRQVTGVAAAADAAGNARLTLPLTLPAGMYLVRGGTATQRLVVE